MSLEIRVLTARGQPLEAEPLALDDDGYYWFLHPLFERLREECGKYIDLYGDALFARDDFPRLRRLLNEAERLTNQERARIFQVHVCTQLHPVEKEIFKPVERTRLLALIADLRGLVDTADARGGVIECRGD